jgi:hypothetical protein
MDRSTEQFSNEVQTANKYMRKCSIPLATREMQTKIPMTFHPIPAKETNNNKCWPMMRVEGTFIYF